MTLEDDLKDIVDDAPKVTTEPKKKKKKKKKPEPLPIVDLEQLEDFSRMIDLPFQLLGKPLLPNEKQNLSLALLHWCSKRMSIVSEYSVDVALAMAIITVVVPRLAIFESANEQNHNDTGEKGDRKNHQSE